MCCPCRGPGYLLSQRLAPLLGSRFTHCASPLCSPPASPGVNKPAAFGVPAPICHALHWAVALCFSSVRDLSFPGLLQMRSSLTLPARVLALALGILVKVVCLLLLCHCLFFFFCMQKSFHEWLGSLPLLPPQPRRLVEAARGFAKPSES